MPVLMFHLQSRVQYYFILPCLLVYFFYRMVQHERYGVLTLVNSTGADTGEFTCFPMYCEDTDCRREYNKAVKVFVFFPGTGE